jgi:hypothetical protein
MSDLGGIAEVVYRVMLVDPGSRTVVQEID